MPFIKNPDADAAFWQNVATDLTQANEAGAEESRRVVSVDSGALRSTIQALNAVITEEEIVSGLKAGGVASDGTVVDYALDEEVRDFFLRNSVDTIIETLTNGDS